MSFATLSARRSAAARLFAVAVLALAWLLGLSAAGHAAELTFNRAYLGALSGQTYTTTTLLNADPGSIRFSDDGTQRTFHNTSGTLYYTVGGAPRAEAGQLKARYPNGNVVVDAVAFEGSAGFRLIVLGGSYTTSSSYGGSSNGIVDRLNEYILATAPDSAQTSIRANGAASATANVGASVTITVAVKLTSGAAVSGATVTLAASPSNLSSTTPTSAVTNASGEASFTVTGTAKGTVTYTAVASAGGSTRDERRLGFGHLCGSEKRGPFHRDRRRRRGGCADQDRGDRP
ncbi:Ig-like domain-containing protein [Phenylobacterium sp. J426]|uniref:Ig-like domain-containing protein n=1 Tax=Phenylobacterium sp. J426 TaxID=2898439 RepID=UPI002150D84C|nr:Ig-like domain-containing protein [Phenylobacterium sp. J426]MCR5873867.1 Ig-like domain-containing protein [Phenylobacterium sp. J426]